MTLNRRLKAMEKNALCQGIEQPDYILLCAMGPDTSHPGDPRVAIMMGDKHGVDISRLDGESPAAFIARVEQAVRP